MARPFPAQVHLKQVKELFYEKAFLPILVPEAKQENAPPTFLQRGTRAAKRGKQAVKALIAEIQASKQPSRGYFFPELQAKWEPTTKRAAIVGQSEGQAEKPPLTFDEMMKQLGRAEQHGCLSDQPTIRMPALPRVDSSYPINTTAIFAIAPHLEEVIADLDAQMSRHIEDFVARTNNQKSAIAVSLPVRYYHLYCIIDEHPSLKSYAGIQISANLIEDNLIHITTKSDSWLR